MTPNDHSDSLPNQNDLVTVVTKDLVRQGVSMGMITRRPIGADLYHSRRCNHYGEGR